jgi:hypothetical protein
MLPSLLPQHLFEASVPQNCTSAPARAMGNTIYIPGMAFDAADGTTDNATHIGAVYSLKLVSIGGADNEARYVFCECVCTYRTTGV